MKDHGARGSAEGRAPRRHFIQHGTEAEQVGAPVQPFAPRLFRGHVRHAAHRCAGARPALGVDRGRLRLLGWERGRLVRLTGTALRNTHGRDARAQTQLCQTEIQNLRLATRGDEDIRRLDVAMDDSFGVGRVRAVSNLNGQGQ